MANDSAMRVIDVSYHNGDINWETIKNRGDVEAAIIRCGYGTSGRDDKFVKNIETCIKLKIPVGVYHFSYSETEAQSKKEALWTAKLVNKYADKLSLPIFYDLEIDGNNKISQHAVKISKSRALAYFQTLEDKGFNSVGVYASSSWFTSYGLNQLPKKYARWVAKWPTGTAEDARLQPNSPARPTIDNYILWQYTSNGSVSGINGRVDMSFLYENVQNNSDGTDYGSSAGLFSVEVNTERLKPYVITVNRKSELTETKVKTFKEHKVSGAMVEAGYRFNKSHTIVDFRNPQFMKQITLLHKHDIPFGFYLIGRARTVKEAKDEIYQFSYPIREYAPPLGAWIKLELQHKKKSENDKIINKYRDELELLGLKRRMGLHVTYADLKLISWDKHQSDWQLWLIDPLNKPSEIADLLNPAFFDTSGKY